MDMLPGYGRAVNDHWTDGTNSETIFIRKEGNIMLQIMQVTRPDGAKARDVRKHHGMTAMRQQGMGVASPEDCWIGLSTIPPDGGIDTGTTPTCNDHFAPSGKPAVSAAGGDTEPDPYASCCPPRKAGRRIESRARSPMRTPVISPN